MRQDEFEHRYHDMQESIKAPEALKAHTVAAARRMTQAQQNRAAKASFRPRRRHGLKTAPNRVFGTPGCVTQTLPRRGVAAVAIVVMLAMATALFLPGGLFGTPSGGGMSPSLFTVKAYAAESGSAIEADDEGRIIFPLDLQTAFQGASDIGDEGIYTGSILAIEGDDILRVQATLEGGELYSYTLDEFVAGEHPDKMVELASWKPTKRGTGDYYGKYDYVSVAQVDDGRAYDDPAKTVQARLVKRLGSTIDIAAEDGHVPLLGLWFSSGAVRPGPLGIDPQSLAGKTLTVTVEFADGRCQTQQIGLRAGTFKVEEAAHDAASATDIMPVEGPFADSDVAGEDSVYLLFGVVESSVDEPHPYPLDNANEHADAPMDAMSFADVLDAGEPVESVSLADDAQIADAVGRHVTELWLANDAGETNTLGRAYLESIEARVADRLPKGYDIFTDTDVASFFGDIEYYDACREITHGYTVDADGTLSDGYRYLVVTMDVRGAAFDAMRYTHVGELATPVSISEDGEVLRSTIAAFGCHVDGRTSDAGNWDQVAVSGDAARRVEIVYIVSDELLQTGRLALELQQPDTDANDETACKPHYVIL